MSESVKFCCSHEEMKTNRKDRHLLVALRLGRIANAIRFFVLAAKPYAEAESNVRGLMRANGFLFQNATIFEGIKTCETILEHSKNLEIPLTELEEYLNDISVIQFKEDLRKVRDKSTFHFDKDIASSSLSEIELDEYVFLSCDDDLPRRYD